MKKDEVVKVEITQCSDPGYWYHDCINLILKVRKHDKERYCVVEESASNVFLIFIKDTKMVKDGGNG